MSTGIAKMRGRYRLSGAAACLLSSTPCKLSARPRTAVFTTVTTHVQLTRVHTKSRHTCAHTGSRTYAHHTPILSLPPFLGREKGGAVLWKREWVAPYPPGARCNSIRAQAAIDGIKRCLSNKESSKALALFERNPAAHARIDAQTYLQLLRAVNETGQWEKAPDVWHAMTVSAAHQPDRQAYTAALKGLGKGREHAKMLEIFEEMRHSGIPPDPWGYATAISSCSEEGDIKKAENLMDEMLASGLMPDATVYCALMKGYAKYGMLDKVMDVREEMDKAGVDVDEYVVSTIVEAYVNSGLLDSAEKLVSEGGVYHSLVNPFAIGSIMKGWAKRGNVDRVLALLDEIKRSGKGQLGVAYNTAISVLLSKGDLHKAVGLVQDMANNNVFLSVATYSMLMQAFGKNGQLKDALDLFDQMRQKGVTPDSTVYTVLLDACVRCRNSARAFELFWEMRKAGLRPSQHTYGVLLKACIHPDTDTAEARQECMRQSFQLFDEMTEDHVPPNTIIYNSMLTVCVKNGLPSDVWNVRDEMKRRRIRSDVFTYGALMAACAKHKLLRQAESLMAEMKQERLAPNDIIYAALCKVYVGCKRAFSARRVLDDMANQNIRPQSETYLTIVEGLAAEAHIEAAAEVIEQMTNQDIRPTARMLSAVILGCASGYGLLEPGGRGRERLAAVAFRMFELSLTARIRVEVDLILTVLSILTRQVRDKRLRELGLRHSDLCFEEISHKRIVISHKKRKSELYQRPDKGAQGVVKGGELREVMVVLKNLEVRGAGLDDATYSDVIQLCLVCEDPVSALKRISEMNVMSQVASEGGSDVMKLTALLNKEAGSLGVEGMIELLELTRKGGVEGSPQAAAALLQVCTHLADFQDAVKLCKALQKSKTFTPRCLEDAYALMIRRFGVGEGAAKALNFAQRTALAGVLVDHSLFSAVLVLSSASQDARLVKALLCALPFSELDAFRAANTHLVSDGTASREERGLMSTAELESASPVELHARKAARAAIQRSVGESHLDRGLGAEMLRGAFDVASFNRPTLWRQVIRAVGRAGMVEEAWDICTAIRAQDATLAGTVLDAYIDSCQEAGKPSLAVVAYEDLRRSGDIKVESRTYMKLLQCQVAAAVGASSQ